MMEAACAICGAPAEAKCSCETERLKLALDQSEQRVISGHLAEIKEWVENKGKERIQEYARALIARRQMMHDTKMAHLQDQALYHGYVAINPSLRAEELQKLQRGINEDWKQALLYYPVVLDHFYNQVRLEIPDKYEEDVRGGPLMKEIESLRSRQSQIAAHADHEHHHHAGPRPPMGHYPSMPGPGPPPGPAYAPQYPRGPSTGPIPGAYPVPPMPPMPPQAPVPPGWPQYPGY